MDSNFLRALLLMQLKLRTKQKHICLVHFLKTSPIIAIRSRNWWGRKGCLSENYIYCKMKTVLKENNLSTPLKSFAEMRELIILCIATGISRFASCCMKAYLEIFWSSTRKKRLRTMKKIFQQAS